MKEITNPDGSEAPPEKVMIWHHWCFEPPKEIKNQNDSGSSAREPVGKGKPNPTAGATPAR